MCCKRVVADSVQPYFIQAIWSELDEAYFEAIPPNDIVGNDVSQLDVEWMNLYAGSIYRRNRSFPVIVKCLLIAEYMQNNFGAFVYNSLRDKVTICTHLFTSVDDL